MFDKLKYASTERVWEGIICLLYTSDAADDSTEV